jgi:hypothetical protein
MKFRHQYGVFVIELRQERRFLIHENLSHLPMNAFHPGQIKVVVAMILTFHLYRQKHSEDTKDSEFSHDDKVYITIMKAE